MQYQEHATLAAELRRVSFLGDEQWAAAAARLGSEVDQRARTLAKDTARLNRNPSLPAAEKMALMQRRFDAAFRPTLLALLELAAETDIGVGENGSLGQGGGEDGRLDAQPQWGRRPWGRADLA